MTPPELVQKPQPVRFPWQDWGFCLAKDLEDDGGTLFALGQFPSPR